MSSFGMLGDYVSKIASKRLSRVDVDASSSHQHEIGGFGREMLSVLGDVDRKARLDNGIPTVSMYLTDDDDPVVENITISWYDTRRGKEGRSPEWRIYYPSGSRVMSLALPGDTLYCGYLKSGELLLAVARSGDAVDSELQWLFGLGEPGDRAVVSDRAGTDVVDVFAAQLLSLMGIELHRIADSDDDILLSEMIRKWGYAFPTGLEFATYAERSLRDVDPRTDDPDAVVLAYYEREYHLFTMFEEAIIQREYETNPFVLDGRLDVPQFTDFYKHVRNRRASRAGKSLEQHVQRVLEARGVAFTPQALTEDGKKPDFLFPGIDYYNNPKYPDEYLRMLAIKTSTKDRWRQVLDEADRIGNKHLFTIAKAGVSKRQNKQMLDKRLTLVMPASIRDTHPIEVRDNTMLFSDFIREVKGLPDKARGARLGLL